MKTLVYLAVSMLTANVVASPSTTTGYSAVVSTEDVPQATEKATKRAIEAINASLDTRALIFASGEEWPDIAVTK